MRQRFISELEFDRLLDAVTTAISPAPQDDALVRPLTRSGPPKAANDNHLVWPLIPFPESWYGAG